jgi:hypothetical protein
MSKIQIFIAQPKPWGEVRFDRIDGWQIPPLWIGGSGDQKRLGFKPCRTNPDLGVFSAIVWLRQVSFAGSL